SDRAKPATPAAKPAPKPAAPKAPAVMETEPWEGELPDALKEKFGDAITGYFRYVGQSFLTAKPEAAVPILEFLKSDWGFDYLVDVTATDDPAKPERFELVYILYSFSRNERIRIKARVKEGDKPATAVPVHITADWLEREVFDMFGIEFAGHPNMTRILLPDEWQGHPLRKDYNILGMDQKWVQENLGIESGQ
ncbi:MAG TPA: NADH-quinone oxidoreductase subunit C, partial [Bryobacteraceae bacterium]|nr:NADH-quinone oxidoreductase subunit C [Bryobacteraceae bacterium]